MKFKAQWGGALDSTVSGSLQAWGARGEGVREGESAAHGGGEGSILSKADSTAEDSARGDGAPEWLRSLPKTAAVVMTFTPTPGRSTRALLQDEGTRSSAPTAWPGPTGRPV